MDLPHANITPIPDNRPDATAKLWNDRYTEIDENFAALTTEVSNSVGGDPATSAGGLDITANHGFIWCTPAEGETALYHLPTYATVGAKKRYEGKNVGRGIARIDAADGKTIDGQTYIELMPGDGFTILKYDGNWQTKP